jgi:hypothetical protein
MASIARRDVAEFERHRKSTRRALPALRSLRPSAGRVVPHGAQPDSNPRVLICRRGRTSALFRTFRLARQWWRGSSHGRTSITRSSWRRHPGVGLHRQAAWVPWRRQIVVGGHHASAFHRKHGAVVGGPADCAVIDQANRKRNSRRGAFRRRKRFARRRCSTPCARAGRSCACP